MKTENAENRKSEIVEAEEVKPEFEKVPAYKIAEHKKEYEDKIVPIFDLQLPDLIFEKMYILFEKVQPLNRKVKDLEIDIKLAKDKMLLETDFKKELNESRPTVAMKEAYMQPFVADKEEQLDDLKEKQVYYEDKVTIINDLIKSERLLLQMEAENLE